MTVTGRRSTYLSAQTVQTFPAGSFLVLLPGRGQAGSLQIAERIRVAIEALAIPHEASTSSTVVTASIGVSSGPIGGINFAELVERADEAMYFSKKSGRNTVGTLS